MSPKQSFQSSAQKIPAALLSCLNSASENVWNRGNVCSAMLFILTNTISFYTAGGGKQGEQKNLCFKSVTIKC